MARSVWPWKPISLVQATRSVAARMISSQAALASDRCRVGWPARWPWASTDAVLHPGVLAMTQFQPAELPGQHPGGCVGDKRGHPQPVGIGERNCAPGCGRSLRRMSRVPTGQPLRSTKSVASATQAPVADVAALLIARDQVSVVLSISTRGLHPGIDGVAEGNLTPCARHASAKAWVAAGRIAADQHLVARLGSAGRAGRPPAAMPAPSPSTVMWSAAVLLPALPGRSRPANARADLSKVLPAVRCTARKQNGEPCRAKAARGATCVESTAVPPHR